ncbi:MAG: radical SAM protein [Candidatus Omnitrophota bacterium]
MKELKYRDFSLNTHSKNWEFGIPSLCQFELTFRCGLHCRHCYTDCYNTDSYAQKELSLGRIKGILDKVRALGVLWLCLTGGDPLARNDFLDIYALAKKKGFLITVFTNGYSMTKEIAAYFKKKPPFSIEITLNATEAQLFEMISQVPGSFKKTVAGIALMQEYGLPLTIKSQITRDNFQEFRKLEKFADSAKAQFKPSINLHARLNGDTAPCRLRISHEEVSQLQGSEDLLGSECGPVYQKGTSENNKLFQCAVLGGDGFQIDPHGNAFLCNLLRKPSFNVLKHDLRLGLRQLLIEMRSCVFHSNSECRTCNLRNSCQSCPGNAYLETGDCEKPLPYFCQLTKLRGQGAVVHNLAKSA